MNISEFLRLEAVESRLGASNKPGVLRELVGVVLRVEPDLDPNQLVETLDRRESLQSTGIGNGVAIPHGKVEKLDRLVACVGRSVEGVDFQSLDGIPTQLFFTLFIPAEEHGMHLKALARISRLFKEERIRNALLEASDAQEMYDVILEEDRRL